MHTTDQNGALARPHSPRDHYRHMPVFPRRHLHALKTEEMLLAGLKVVDVKRADDLLPLDHIAGIDGPPRRSRRFASSVSDDSEGDRGSNGGGRCNQEVAAIETFFGIVGHGVNSPFFMMVRSENETHNGRDIPRLQGTECAVDLIRAQDCCTSYVGIGSDEELCSVVRQTPG